MPYMGEVFTEPDNEDRANWALAALNTFAKETHFDPREQTVDPEDKDYLEEVAGDLICDLMHLLHQAGIDPEEVIPTARYNFNYELEDEAQADGCEWFVNRATERAWCCNTHLYDGTGDYPATGEHPDECPFAEVEE